MISRTDIQGRLRLLRYGLIVVVIVAFFVALLVPYAAVATFLNNNPGVGDITGAAPSITDGLVTAVIATIVTAIVAVVIYIVYGNIIKRNASS